MKTKLLKIVRNRYSINYYPKGRYIFTKFVNKPIMFLTDKQDSWKALYLDIDDTLSKDQAYPLLLTSLLEIIRREYKHCGTRRNKIRRKGTDNGIKLWWK
jgi:hypothetical protein